MKTGVLNERGFSTGSVFWLDNSHASIDAVFLQAIAISLIGQYHPEDGGTSVSDSMMQDVRDLIDCAVQQVR